MLRYLAFVLWTDLKRRSAWALALSIAVIAISIALCGMLFASAAAVSAAVERDIARSGATDSMDVAARPDREYRKPWAAPPIGTEEPAAALDRLVGLLRGELPVGALRDVEPAWLSPGWVYLYLTPPEGGGAPVAAGMSLSSPTDPEQIRLAPGRVAGGWLSSQESAQVILPEKLADRLWQDVLFVGEPAWIGIDETSTCVRATVAGIYGQTQRDYCYANRPVVDAVRAALAEEAPPPGFDRVRLYFADRSWLLTARRIVEERYRFWAVTPYDRFEGRIQLVAALRLSAWTVFGITAVTAFGTVCCTFLAWVSRRRYEIALLKAQGASSGWVAGMYLLQSGAAGLVAGCLGVMVSRLLCPRLAFWLAGHLDWDVAPLLDLPFGVGLALVAASAGLAVAAAVPPAWLAARTDPWAILREAG